MQMTRLQPGLLVALSTSIKGNTRYDKIDLETGTIAERGVQIDRWETKRTIDDPNEARAATEIRSRARAIISRACAQSSRFGLLCPLEKRAALERAIDEAQSLAASFNRRARLTRVHVDVILGYVAPDDERAVVSIRREIRELIEDMEQGVRALDPEKIRDSATRAKELVEVLPSDAGVEVMRAVETARDAARVLVRAAKVGAASVDEFAIKQLRRLRYTFLEPNESNGAAAPRAIGADFALRNLDLDFDPTPNLEPESLSSDSVPL